MQDFWKHLYYFLWVHLGISIVDAIFSVRYYLGNKWQDDKKISEKKKETIRNINRYVDEITHLVNRQFAVAMNVILVVFMNFIQFNYITSMAKRIFYKKEEKK